MRTIVTAPIDGRWVRFRVKGSPRWVLSAGRRNMYAAEALALQAKGFARLVAIAIGREP